MTKESLLNIVYSDASEEKLKSALMERIEKYGFESTFLNLVYTNQLLLNSCGINGEMLNKMLFKNYILNQNSITPKVNILEVSIDDQKIIERFNRYIENNDFINAFDVYEKHFVVFAYLCLSYLKNLKKSNNALVNEICSNKVNYVYNQLLVLSHTNLKSKEIPIKKVRQIVSER